MADIQVRIQLNAGVDGDQIHRVSFDKGTNNVSKLVGQQTTQNSGKNLISWGENGLISLSDGYVGGSNSTLGKQNGYNGFVFGVVPESKEYSVEVILEGSNIDSVTFYGDKTANQFPTRAIVNGEYIYSDDGEWSIVFPNTADTQTITFDMWNRPNYNACFTHISVLVQTLILDKKWIKNVESLSQSTDRPNELFYGVIPNSGYLEILDINGEIKDYVESGIIEISNTPITIYANGKQVQQHISSDTSYRIENKTLEIQLTNLLEKENNEISFYELYNLNYVNDTSLYLVLSGIFGQDFVDKISQGHLKIDNYGNESKILDYIQSINIGNVIIKPDSYRNIISNLLTVAQLNLITNDSGETKLVSSRPYKLESEKVIVIPKKNQFSELSMDVILKNKYDNVECNFYKIYDSIENVFEKTYNIRDSEGNLHLSNINETATYFIDNNGDTNICFFITITSENPIYQFNVSLSEDSVNPYYMSVGTDTESTGGNLQGIPTSNLSKEEFVFRNSQNADQIVRLTKYDSLNSHTFAVQFDLKESIYNWVPSKIYLSINAKSYSINNETIRYNNNAKNICVINDNIFLSNTTEFDEENIFDYISRCILYDYKDGIKTAKITISCSNYYFENENIVAKNWSVGEIIEVHDIVKIEGNDKLWRVTGRNFRKQGVPMIDLELQEIKE